MALLENPTYLPGPDDVSGSINTLAATDPQAYEGLFIVSDVESQQAALAQIPRHHIEVVRRTPYRDPIEVEGGTIYQESTRYSDGAVRLSSLAVPDEVSCQYLVSNGDPWLTGPNGFNKLALQLLMRAGFIVLWNHHQAEHSVLPTSHEHLQTVANFFKTKSVSLAAAQDHALIDDIAHNADFITDKVIRKGFSRSAMSGEAFIAQTGLPGVQREVIWSDLKAACFAHRIGKAAFMAVVARQLPHELEALQDIYQQVNSGAYEAEIGKISLSDYGGTMDPSPLNLLHELSWFRLLISGETGPHGRAIALDAKGTRTIYDHDYSSQQADWEEIHAPRPGIIILREKGAHLTGASPKALVDEHRRDQRLAEYARNHDGDLSDVSYEDVLLDIGQAA